MKRIFNVNGPEITDDHKTAAKASRKAAALEVKAWAKYNKIEDKAYKAKVAAHKARDEALIAYAVYANFKAADAAHAAKVAETKAAKAAGNYEKIKLNAEGAQLIAKAAKERSK